MNNSNINKAKKLISRGLFYSIKIELFKIMLNKKSEGSFFRKLLILILQSITKFTKHKYSRLILMYLKNDHEFYSQLGQDLFVLNELGKKKEGFFIEIGAGDGFYLSNTYLLEKNFGWTGILVEPNKSFYNSCINLRRCTTINQLVLAENHTSIRFFEKSVGEFSHSEGFGDVTASKIESTYEVSAIRFEEIFDGLSDVPDIDFLSIDTEGSEVEILKTIDFFKYKPRIISIEHNYVKNNRIFLKKFLNSKGYRLVYSGLSQWDSWFISKNQHDYFER